MSDSALPGPTAPRCAWAECVQPAVARVALQSVGAVIGQSARIEPTCAEHLAVRTGLTYLRGVWDAGNEKTWAVVILPLEAGEPS